MNETTEDLARLRALLDRSRTHAGPHVARVVSADDRWMSAEALVGRLRGMCLLTVATVTADGRPITGPVDGFFHRGSWWFGSAPDSVKVRHLRRRPAVSATHLPGEHLAVTVHGTAALVDPRDPAHGLVPVLDDHYGPGFLDGYGPDGATYVRIDAERMIVFHLDPDEAAGSSA